MTTTTHTAIEVLDEHTCWRLVATQEVGRLAVVVDRHPDIFPVNFTVVDKSVVFRTAEGTKLLSVVIGPNVAFEVDGYDHDTEEAWSVIVKGSAIEVPMFDAVDDSIPVFPWSSTVKGRFVRIVPENISGRRFHVTQHRPATV